MPPPQLFSGLGLFVHESFLDETTRKAIVADAAHASGERAAVEAGAGIAIDSGTRRAEEVTAPEPSVRLIDARFDLLRPALEEHFGVLLAGAEPVGLLRYKQGGFYRPHRDRSSGTPASCGRAVSVVIFVNGREGGDGYSGGTLRFYGLMEGSRLADVGLDMEPVPGTLVAFRSDCVHEVTPVTAGVRYTIVTWFSEREDGAQRAAADADPATRTR